MPPFWISPNVLFILWTRKAARRVINVLHQQSSTTTTKKQSSIFRFVFRDFDASSTIGRHSVMILRHQMSVFAAWTSRYLLYCINRISVFVYYAIIGQKKQEMWHRSHHSTGWNSCIRLMTNAFYDFFKKEGTFSYNYNKLFEICSFALEHFLSLAACV